MLHIFWTVLFNLHRFFPEKATMLASGVLNELLKVSWCSNPKWDSMYSFSFFYFSTCTVGHIFTEVGGKKKSLLKFGLLSQAFFNIFFLFSLEMQELKIRPLPIVFAVFSSGLKACMYKVLQVMFGKVVHSILFGCALIFLPISLLGNYCFLNLCPHLSLNQWMVCLYCCERNSLWFSLFSPDYWSEVWRRSKFGMFLYMLVEIIFSTWLLL